MLTWLRRYIYLLSLTELLNVNFQMLFAKKNSDGEKVLCRHGVIMYGVGHTCVT